MFSRTDRQIYKYVHALTHGIDIVRVGRQGVLQIYDSGLVCVLAHSEAEACEILYRKDPRACLSLQGNPLDGKPKTMAELEQDYPRRPYPAPKLRPKSVTVPDAFICHGGT